MEAGFGHWFAPRALRFAGPDDPLALRELFGPVLGVLVADDLDHAVALANATPFGLSASLFTRDLHAAMAYLRRIEVGLVRINGLFRNGWLTAPALVDDALARLATAPAPEVAR